MKSSVLWFPHMAHNVLCYHRRPSMASLHSLNAEGFAVVRVNCRAVRLCRSPRLCLNIQSICAIDESYYMSHIKMAFVGALFLFHAIQLVAVIDFIASYRWMENVERTFLARVCSNTSNVVVMQCLFITLSFGWHYWYNKSVFYDIFIYWQYILRKHL